MWNLRFDIIAYMILQPALGLLNFLIFCRKRKTMATPEGRLLRAIFCFPYTAACCCCCRSIGNHDDDDDGDDDGDKNKNKNKSSAAAAATTTSSVDRSASTV